MADNIAVTPGSGATVAADEVGGALYQRVKLAVGADGAAADLAPGQATMAASVPVVLASNHSDVKVSLDSEAVVLGAGTAEIGKLAAGEALVGLVGASDVVVTVTPTLDTNAYASGDLLFDSTEVAAAVRANGGHAILESVTIIDKGDQGVAFTLLIANAATDFGTLNSAPDADDTECATVIGWAPVATSDYVDLGAAKVACIRNIGLLLKAGAATTSVWVAGVNGTGTPTFGASDLVVQLGFLRS